jgi:hypothetical protein
VATALLSGAIGGTAGALSPDAEDSSLRSE